MIVALSNIDEGRTNDEHSTDILEINYTYVHVYVRVVEDEQNWIAIIARDRSMSRVGFHRRYNHECVNLILA